MSGTDRRRPTGGRSRETPRRSISRRRVHEAHQSWGARRCGAVALSAPVAARNWRQRQGHDQDRDRAARSRAASKAASDPIINGVKLAVKQAGGTAGGYTIDRPADSAVYDDALNGAHDPQTGANNMTKIVGEPTTSAVIGPLNSSVAQGADPDLERGRPAPVLAGQHATRTSTKGDRGQAAPDQAEQLHPRRHHRRRSRVRPRPPYIIRPSLKKTSVYIIDDTETFGKGIADCVRGGVQGPRRHRRQARRGPEDDPGLRLDHDGRQGPQPPGRSTSAA